MRESAPGARCEACGFAASEWSSATSRRWLASALGVRARLAFEGVPEGWSLEDLGDEAALAGELGRLLEGGDLHGAVHLAATAARASAGSCPRRAGLTGRVVQVSASDGGVPKHPLAEAEVDWRGLAGDRQRHGRHHGHPWQALCLWSAEVISSLRADGHPVSPGAAGENLTLAGLDWALLRSGVTLEIGTVRCVLTAPATPCRANARWFLDGRIEQMSHEHHPGRSRWYAQVSRPGRVRPGDGVRMLGS